MWDACVHFAWETKPERLGLYGPKPEKVWDYIIEFLCLVIVWVRPVLLSTFTHKYQSWEHGASYFSLMSQRESNPHPPSSTSKKNTTHPTSPPLWQKRVYKPCFRYIITVKSSPYPLHHGRGSPTLFSPIVGGLNLKQLLGEWRPRGKWKATSRGVNQYGPLKSRAVAVTRCGPLGPLGARPTPTFGKWGGCSQARWGETEPASQGVWTGQGWAGLGCRYRL